jgi:tetratricopeptide (TPR) repeat protein
MLGEHRYADARASIDQLGERYSGSLDYQVLAGDVALAAGDSEQAMTHYRLAAQVRRNFPINLRLVRALQQAGRDRAARATALEFLGQNPLDRDAAWLSAEMAIEQRDWRQARLLLEHIGRLEPGARDPGRMALLALSELQSGETELALAHAQDAYRMQRMNARANFVLALVLKQTGGTMGQVDELTRKAKQMGIDEDPLFRGL